MTHPLCVLTVLAHAVVTAQATPPGRETPLFGLLAFVSLGVWAWLGRRQGRLMRASALAQAEATRAQDALAAYKKAQGTKSHGAQDRLKEMTLNLAAQKKKNYVQGKALAQALADKAQAQAQAEEAMAQALKARRHLERADRAPQAKRADAVAPQKRAPEPEMPDTAPAVVATVSAMDAAPQAEDTAVPDTAAQEAAHALQAAEALAEAERAQMLADARTQAQEAKGKLKETRQQLARLTKRLEDQRRVDLMSRGKISVLEDKLRRMGRDYYETISALAIARGEVLPPRPKSKTREAMPAAAEQAPVGDEIPLLIPQSQRPS